MLTLPEKIIFVIAALATAALVLRAIFRMVRIIGRGRGRPGWKLIPRRLFDVGVKTVGLTPVWRKRFLTSLFHAMVVWAFMFYLFVNIGDVLEGIFPNFTFLRQGIIGNGYRLLADLLSVSALVGMAALDVLALYRFIIPALS